MSGNAEASESNKSISDVEIRSDREVENVKYRSDLQSNRSDTQTTDDGNGTSSLSENVGDAIDRLCLQTVEVTTDSQNVLEKAGMEDPDGSQSQDLSRVGPPVGRTYTMKELLEELKEENPETIRSTEASDAAPQTDTSSYSQEAAQQQYVGQSNVTIDLINSVTGFDEEAYSRQRTLSFAVKRYATALERNPEDYDALYNWALVLQESADNVGPDSNSTSKDTLLEEACKKYDEATEICPTLHDAFYNWAIAISDRARMRGRTKEAEEFWKQATNYYERAVQLNWNSPQALNNWGLALQELSAIVPLKEKQTIVRTAISKFRAAIRLQFDFHRAIYYLGTVLYGLAEDTLRTGRQISTKEIAPDDLYSQSAIYIAAAHALKQNYSKTSDIYQNTSPNNPQSLPIAIYKFTGVH